MTKGTTSRPIAVDLFAGAGGLSLGFEQAGFDVVAAVESDPVHAATHAFNFPGCKVLAHSVSELSGDTIRREAGIGGSVDCVFGGPPCQGFSLMGQRCLNDPRNSLILEFVRLVKELRARTFVFENVKGLSMGRHRELLVELVSAFDAAGYDVRLPWQVLDAASFGVPQHRERLILIGARRGTVLPEYPVPITTPADRPEGFHRMLAGPTCKDVLEDLPNADDFVELIGTDAVLTNRYGSLNEYSSRFRCLTADSWHYGNVRAWDRTLLTSSARTIHTEISRRRFSETAPGTVEPISRFFRLSPDGLCNTLRAGTDGSRGAFTSPRPIHYAYPRCITVREMARLHGFPDWFRFHSTKWHGARQIGNSVPPPLARCIANAIVTALAVKPEMGSLMPLGDQCLLYMEMSEAAKYFGVPPPARRRNRSIGSKRKQSEIEAARVAAELCLEQKTLWQSEEPLR